MTLEHAPEGRRGYFTSFTLNGTQFGQILATLVFIPVAALPEEQLLSWGWRVPFWCSLVVAVVGYFIRRHLDETPAFQAQVADGSVPKMPLAELFRTHWADVLRVVGAALIATVSTIFTVWALNYATSDEIGLDRAVMLWVGVLGQRRRAGRDPVVGPAVRPHRPPSGVPDRRGRQPDHDLRLPGLDQLGQLPAHLPGGLPLLRGRLLGVQRHLARPVRRDVHHPRPPVGHGHRHPDRLRRGRLRGRRRRRAS